MKTCKSRYTSGQLVTIVPHWRDPTDTGAPMVYRVVEDNGDRLIIAPTVWDHGQLVPQELVAYYMVQPVV